jgi:hypothetical protein
VVSEQLTVEIILSVVSITISTVLPLFILRYFKIRETKEKERAKELKETTERTSHDLKGVTEHNANEIKYSAEKTAKELKEATSQIAIDLVRQTDLKNEVIINKVNSAISIIEENTKRMNELDIHVDEINTKQIEMGKTMETMIANLHQKADMTNGNVEKIRMDVLNLQEDTDDVYEQLSSSNSSRNINQQQQQQQPVQTNLSTTTRRKRKRKIDNRRAEILRDSTNQHAQLDRMKSHPSST